MDIFLQSEFRIGGVATTKIVVAKMLDLGEQLYFVWDAAYESAKWQDILKILATPMLRTHNPAQKTEYYFRTNIRKNSSCVYSQ